MPKEYNRNTMRKLIKDNYVYADALGDDPEQYMDAYLEANAQGFFDVTDPTRLAGYPRSRYADYSESHLGTVLANHFCDWLKEPKTRLNLSVYSDIPMLLSWLAGSERRMGSYVDQLVREDYERKQEAGINSLENNDLEEDTAWEDRLSGRLKRFSNRPAETDVQATTLENKSIDERLRRLERKVEELSHQGES